MRAALAVPMVTADADHNLTAVLGLADEAAGQGADLVLFPEAVVTGLSNTDVPAHDLPLGQPIPGPATHQLGAWCHGRGVWFGLGLLERAGDRLFDSAVLLDPAGDLRLHYRRNQPQWHGRDASPAVYRQGTDVPAADTPFGRLAFLLCGDLFDDDVVARCRAARPDLLLFPFARCFGNGTIDQARWDREEWPDYAARVRLAGLPTLMVNYLGDRVSLPDDNSFGGAFYAAPDGTRLASLPLGQTGVLMVDTATAGMPGRDNRRPHRPQTGGQP